MNQQNEGGKNSENTPPGHNQEPHITIHVNGTPKHISTEHITFTQVVELAFGSLDPGKSYTMAYDKGPKENPSGTMSEGDTVKVKSGMVFNVTATNKS